MELDTTTALSAIALVVAVGSAILQVINHTRVRSSCCGKKIEASLDISKTENVSP